MITLNRHEQLQELVGRDFPAFSGYALERYFQWKTACESTSTNMGAWWDRKGENEIDLVCEDELKGTIDFYEIKVDEGRFCRKAFEAKVEAFLEKHPEKSSLRRRMGALSLKDM